MRTVAANGISQIHLSGQVSERAVAIQAKLSALIRQGSGTPGEQREAGIRRVTSTGRCYPIGRKRRQQCRKSEGSMPPRQREIAPSNSSSLPTCRARALSLHQSARWRSSIKDSPTQPSRRPVFDCEPRHVGEIGFVVGDHCSSDAERMGREQPVEAGTLERQLGVYPRRRFVEW